MDGRPPLQPGIDEKISAGGILQMIAVEEAKLRRTTGEFKRRLTGPHCYSLHRLLADQWSELGEGIAGLQARGAALGCDDPGAEAALAELSAGPNAAAGLLTSGMLLALARGHEALTARLRSEQERCSAGLADPATVEMLGGLVQFHETAAWILRTALESEARLSGP